MNEQTIAGRIDAAWDEANKTIWEIVARHFPEAQTGDLEPGITVALHTTLRSAVEAWVQSNVTPAVLLAGRCFRVEGVETTGADFGEANADGLSAEEWDNVAALMPGEFTVVGGGAAPEIQVSRVS